MKKINVILVYAVLAVATLAVYWQVMGFDFVNYDDIDYVTENQHVLDGLSFDGVVWAFTDSQASANWHPLTWLSLMTDCQMFGNDPGWMHFVNLIFHVLNSLLVLAVLKKMTGMFWPSAFVAAVFAIHPMHVESVAWISERKDVLSTFFMLLTFWVYSSYVKDRSVSKYLATLFLFVLSLLSKPMLVTLPFLLLLFDYWPFKRFEFETEKTAINKSRVYQLILEKIPFLILSAAISILTFMVQRIGGAMMEIEKVNLQSRIENALLAYIKYIGKMFWPTDLSVIYPLDVNAIQLWQVLISALLLVFITGLAIYLGRKQKYLPVGWFWFLGTLVPVIGLVQVGGQSMADRYSYIPYVGLLIMIAWGTAALVCKLRCRKVIVGAAVSIIIFVFGAMTYKQVGYWKDSFTLFTHAIKVTKNNFVMQFNLSVAYINIGRYPEAIKFCNEAIRINPDYVEAYNNLGIIYRKLGDGQKEIENYKQAIRIDPTYAKAYYNLGIAYIALGNFQERMENFKLAVENKPDFGEANFNLGVCYSIVGSYEEAIECYKTAVKNKRNFVEGYFNLANALGKVGRNNEAIENYKQTIRIKPDFVSAYNNLGNVYGRIGNSNKEIELYRQAIKIQPDNIEANFNLGICYGKLGKYEEAIECYKTVIKTKPDFANAYVNLGIMLRNIDRLQEAIEAYKQAIIINPNYTDAHYYLGVAYLAADEKDLAFEEYKILKNLDQEQANKLFPDGNSPANTK